MNKDSYFAAPLTNPQVSGSTSQWVLVIASLPPVLLVIVNHGPTSPQALATLLVALVLLVWRHRGKNTPQPDDLTLVCQGDDWFLVDCAQRKSAIEIEPDTLVHPNLVILHYRPIGADRKRRGGRLASIVGIAAPSRTRRLRLNLLWRETTKTPRMSPSPSLGVGALTARNPR